jgi:hypothetical protein
MNQSCPKSTSGGVSRESYDLSESIITCGNELGKRVMGWAPTRIATQRDVATAPAKAQRTRVINVNIVIPCGVSTRGRSEDDG